MAVVRLRQLVPGGILGDDNTAYRDPTYRRLERWGVSTGRSAPIHAAGVAKGMSQMALAALERACCCPFRTAVQGGPELQYGASAANDKKTSHVHLACISARDATDG